MSANKKLRKKCDNNPELNYDELRKARNKRKKAQFLNRLSRKNKEHCRIRRQKAALKLKVYKEKQFAAKAKEQVSDLKVTVDHTPALTTPNKDGVTQTFIHEDK